MMIEIRHACIDPDLQPFDVAERKGIGHPDTLADLIADTFSLRYSLLCLDEFGVIPNHWVDKVNLVGAVAEVGFGGFQIRKPIDCYLFGKITDQVGAKRVPVESIFKDSVSAVMSTALGDSRALNHVRLHINNTRGIAVDHHPEFYTPSATSSLASVLADESVANDTVVCVGSSRRGISADIAVRLESHITSVAFRNLFPPVGTDVKVMIVRLGSKLDVTIAIPFHPEQTPSWGGYRTCIDDIKVALSAELGNIIKDERMARVIREISLCINTKDTPGRGYLAPFGTSLGKGDCGVVGRGNRYSGVIEPLRPASCEAPAGKNPVHHSGKIYLAVAEDIARQVLSEMQVYAEITIVARNGSLLNEPAYVLIALDQEVSASVASSVRRVVQENLAEVGKFKERFLANDPIERFRGRLQP